MKLEKWLQLWLDEEKYPRLKLRSFTRYRDLVDNYILPDLGGRDIGSISQEDVRRLMNGPPMHAPPEDGEYEIRSLSASSANLLRTILRGAFRSARDWGITDADPCASIGSMRTAPRKIEAFTMDEQSAIERSVVFSADARAFGIIVCLYTGLRIGELLALEWEDVDLSQGIISVNKTVYSAKNRDGDWVTVVDSPKSEASRRGVPVSAGLLEELRRRYEARTGRHVVCDKNGRPVLVRTYQYLFKRICAEADVRPLNFHALRHTFATRALETGMDIKTLSELMGHESVTVTLKNYGHSFMATKRKAINELDKIYAENRSALPQDKFRE